ncbi:MAG: glycosyltransferase [Planctomycetaceae bacterium]
MPMTTLDHDLKPHHVSDGVRKRLLLVSYHFPPVGGAGVQRPLKFVKYLRRFGWDATVLMAANPSVPVFDESLLADIPSETTLLKARTWEPSYRLKGGATSSPKSADDSRLKPGIKQRAVGVVRNMLRRTAGILLQPDPQILWAPNAYREACRYLAQVPHDAILATAPSYSNLLLGCHLKHKFGLPLVVDFRDEWDLSSQYLENSQRDRLSQFVQQRMQRRVLRTADMILATTKSSTARLQERAQQVQSIAPAECIYNGYDDDDFEDLLSANAGVYRQNERFRIVYTGTLWNLTSVEPIMMAMEELQRTDPQLTERIEFVGVGRKTPEQRHLLERMQRTGCRLILKEYCSHTEALSEMQSADALCLLLSDLPGAERVAPAKLFEYMALQKPILAVVPEGETAGIVRSVWPEHCFTPRETSALADWLKARAKSPGSLLESIGTDKDRQIYRREFQAGQLADVLNRVIASVRI